jgi:hypothetical protein
MEGMGRQERLHKAEWKAMVLRCQSMVGLCRRSQGIPRTTG